MTVSLNGAKASRGCGQGPPYPLLSTVGLNLKCFSWFFSSPKDVCTHSAAPFPEAAACILT